jgi:hypothetical protein
MYFGSINTIKRENRYKICVSDVTKKIPTSDDSANIF